MNKRLEKMSEIFRNTLPFIVTSATTLDLKLQIYLNVIDTLVNNFSLRQISCLFMYSFHHKQKHWWTQKTAPWWTESHTQTHTSNTYRLLRFTKCVLSCARPRPVLWRLTRFQVTPLLLRSNSQEATFPTPTCTGALQVFLKVKHHIQCRSFAFLNDVTYAELRYHFLSVPVFF